jgi:dolichol-phosphate mannosyltransferase
LAPHIVCTLPTYEEAENILPISRELLDLRLDLEVLVVDDDSPDGTWRLVREESRREPRLHLLHRTTDRGRGRAGRDGFVRALEMGAEIVVEMDADFSHQPRHVPELIAALEAGGDDVGLVLGSRGVDGGRDEERGALRRGLTAASNAFTRAMLGVSVRDCNSGFRCWRRSTLERIRVEETASPGPAIVQELLHRTARAGIGIVEVPIEFRERAAGESTLTAGKLLQGGLTVLRLRLMSLTGGHGGRR